MLSLTEAMKAGRLDEFIAQEEAKGLGTVERQALDEHLAQLIKGPRLEGQTSRSSSDDDSIGTRTRPDSEPYTSR